MSDWFADRSAALLRLRRAQTRVVTGVVPNIAAEDGAIATPSVLHLDGPRGGRFVVQRVRVERTLAPFDAGASFASAEAEWNAEGSSGRTYAPKVDGSLRLELRTPDGEFHSITLLHGGRVLQLTSYSPELDVPHPADDGEGGGDDAQDAAADPLSADTLDAPPEFAHVDQAAAVAEGGTAADPRPEHIAAEERSAGPDYGYRLRHAG
ncbi:hypothetical protein GCM10011490_19700 [Pseudoclavibacter endophyticus]|uniref:Uncharacterized protein n=1 Tax=Pseudoclavibacter endophyticus TaxID=1778590 RepID=A0A6H9WGA0_9MICO|nr:hypothetical protein [Pseudoclavibacter endophyticus]KAB1648034.1 hypothetical protein F8O04_09875 [Pseudoclavibacter endophyticus]GGA69167.1 hypothetical protein GCM10011490_19700 [Pseudoclavibacter endophyticus]